MRGHTILFAAAVCGLLVGGSACDKIEMSHREGALCSSEGTCPPGQQCSPDGMCLKPCPVRDCTGTECGCDDLSDDWHPDTGHVCQPDGLCHLACDDQTFYCPGNEGFTCDAAEGVCKHQCTTETEVGVGTCPPGTQCLPFDDWSSVCVECTDCDTGSGG